MCTAVIVPSQYASEVFIGRRQHSPQTNIEKHMKKMHRESEFSCRRPARTHHGSGRSLRSAITNRFDRCRQGQQRNLEEDPSVYQSLRVNVNLTKLLSSCAVMIIYTRPAWATHRKLSHGKLPAASSTTRIEICRNCNGKYSEGSCSTPRPVGTNGPNSRATRHRAKTFLLKQRLAAWPTERNRAATALTLAHAGPAMPCIVTSAWPLHCSLPDQEVYASTANTRCSASHHTGSYTRTKSFRF